MILQSWCIGNPSLVYFVESIHDNYSREATTGGYTGTIAPANTAVVVLSLVVVFVVLLVPMLVLSDDHSGSVGRVHKAWEHFGGSQ